MASSAPDVDTHSPAAAPVEASTHSIQAGQEIKQTNLAEAQVLTSVPDPVNDQTVSSPAPAQTPEEITMPAEHVTSRSTSGDAAVKDTTQSEQVSRPNPISQSPTSHSLHEEVFDLKNAPTGVQELASMFPEIQPSILEAVLAAHGNDPGACVSDLLAMSDPTWKPSNEDVVEQSDEELARQLAYQEGQQTHPENIQPQFNVPYQPRIKRAGSGSASPAPWQSQDLKQTAHPDSEPGTSGKDELQKITDELSKLAETGKKTMSTWLNKAKAKMQEIQNHNQQGSSSPENLHSYEHVGPPSPVEQPNSNASQRGNPSPSNRSSRISPALPFASRYEKPSTASPSAGSTTMHGTTRKTSPNVEGYQVDRSPPATKGAGSSAQAAAGIPSTRAGITHKIQQDDEESLEYTRNPFEDDD